MYQVRIHGRGGQGVVSAARILAAAAFDEGKFTQSFPELGPEAYGRPVVSSCRIHCDPVHAHGRVQLPDAVILFDLGVLDEVDALHGLHPRGILLYDSFGEQQNSLLENRLKAFPGIALCPVPATELALRHVGCLNPTAALLGAFAAVTREVSLQAVIDVVRERSLGGNRAGLVRAAEDAYRAMEHRVAAPA